MPDVEHPPSLVPLSSVQARSVDWLWRPYLPLGKLTILAGEGGLGKTTVALDIAARVSRGAPMPDGSQSDPAHVVIFTAEDGIGDTIRPRCEVAGADLDRVLVLKDESALVTFRDVDLFDELLGDSGARLVIIDPLSVFIACDYVTKPHLVRQALTPMAALAERRGLSVLIVAHVTKAGAGRAMQRVEGAASIGNASRSVLMLGQDPKDDARLVLAHAKSNLAALGPSWSLARVAAADGTVRVQWNGPSDVRADELAYVPPPGEATKLRQAEEMLAELLADGPVLTRDVEAEAKRRDVGWRTVQTARGKLGIIAARSGRDRTDPYEWRMPDDGEA